MSALRKALGWLIIAIPFGILFAACAASNGFWTAVGIFTTAIVFTGLIVLGVMLTCD